MAKPRLHSHGSLKLSALEWAGVIGVDKRTINRLLQDGLSIEQICEKYEVDPFADEEQANNGTISYHIEMSLALSRRKAIRRLYHDLKENIPHYFSPEFKGLQVA